MSAGAKTRRKVVGIDEEKCTGCGECIPNCPEGALQIIDGKARLVSDLFCDGLGACIGHCPEDAITVEEREAEEYDERRVMENIVPQGPNTIRAHLEHLRDHGAEEYLAQALAFLRERGIEAPPEEEEAHAHDAGHGACPGSRVVDLSARHKYEDEPGGEVETAPAGRRPSRLGQWPVQLALVPAAAPFFKDADLVISADCVPFAYPDFHEDFLKGKVLLVGCPKLDDYESYERKLAQVFRENDVRSATCVHMTVPCCYGLVALVRDAIAASGKDVPFREEVVSVEGDRVQAAETASDGRRAP